MVPSFSRRNLFGQISIPWVNKYNFILLFSANLSVNDVSPSTVRSRNSIENDIICNNSENPKNIGILRRREDSLAAIFLPIIMIFLICSLPRIILDVDELATFHRVFFFNFYLVRIANRVHVRPTQVTVIMWLSC